MLLPYFLPNLAFLFRRSLFLLLAVLSSCTKITCLIFIFVIIHLFFIIHFSLVLSLLLEMEVEEGSLTWRPYWTKLHHHFKTSSGGVWLISYEQHHHQKQREAPEAGSCGRPFLATSEALTRVAFITAPGQHARLFVPGWPRGEGEDRGRESEREDGPLVSLSCRWKLCWCLLSQLLHWHLFNLALIIWSRVLAAVCSERYFGDAYCLRLFILYCFALVYSPRYINNICWFRAWLRKLLCSSRIINISDGSYFSDITITEPVAMFESHFENWFFRKRTIWKLLNMRSMYELVFTKFMKLSLN